MYCLYEFKTVAIHFLYYSFASILITGITGNKSEVKYKVHSADRVLDRERLTTYICLYRSHGYFYVAANLAVEPWTSVFGHTK